MTFICPMQHYLYYSHAAQVLTLIGNMIGGFDGYDINQSENPLSRYVWKQYLYWINSSYIIKYILYYIYDGMPERRRAVNDITPNRLCIIYISSPEQRDGIRIYFSPPRSPYNVVVLPPVYFYLKLFIFQDDFQRFG